MAHSSIAKLAAARGISERQLLEETFGLPTVTSVEAAAEVLEVYPTSVRHALKKHRLIAKREIVIKLVEIEAQPS